MIVNGGGGVCNYLIHLIFAFFIFNYKCHYKFSKQNEINFSIVRKLK